MRCPHSCASPLRTADHRGSALRNTHRQDGTHLASAPQTGRHPKEPHSKRMRLVTSRQKRTWRRRSDQSSDQRNLRSRSGARSPTTRQYLQELPPLARESRQVARFQPHERGASPEPGRATDSRTHRPGPSNNENPGSSSPPHRAPRRTGQPLYKTSQRHRPGRD